MPLYLIISLITLLFAAIVFYRFLSKKNTLPDLKLYSEDIEILEIRVTKAQLERGDLQTAPIASEHLFASLHGLLNHTPEEQEHIAFEIASSPKGIKFYVSVPRMIRSFVESQIYAQYPTATITKVEDYVKPTVSETSHLIGTDIQLAKPQIFPIKTFKDFEVDPISAITSALSEINDEEEIWLQLLVKPIPDNWQKEGLDYVKQVREGTLSKKDKSLLDTLIDEGTEILSSLVKNAFTGPTPISPIPAKPLNAQPPRLSSGQELEIKAIENKMTKMGFDTSLRVVAVSNDKIRAKAHLRAVIASLKQFSTANLNGFISSGGYQEGSDIYELYKLRSFSAHGSYVLNTEELASLYHLPSAIVETPAIAWSHAKKGEPPLYLPTENCTYFGVTNFRNKQIKFGITDEDRMRHLYLLGKTGSGKSQLFRNMIIQDMRNGKGVGVLDPHGTLIDEILEAIPENRLQDVVYFDPADIDRPTALNMLEVIDPKQKNLMASGIVAAFRQQFGFSWGPRLEYLLNICILTLLEVEGTTLLGITRLLTDDNYRKFILHFVKDPVLKEFWEKEFKEMKANPKLITEAVAPIQNKVGRFLSSSTMRNILGRAKSTVRIDEIMNTNKIFLANLSKGKIGEDNANLLGSLLVSRLQFVALQRANMAEKDRQDFFLFVDEFQNFASAGSFESILSEARKYRLSLHLTHQYTAQLPETIASAVFGNVGTMISMALGAPDAKVLATEFAPTFDESDLIALERRQIYLKLMINGMTSTPFSAVSMERISDITNLGAKAMEISREKYGQDKEMVEEKIKLWVERKFDLGMAIANEKRKQAALEAASAPAPDSSNPTENTSSPTVSGEFNV